VSRISGVVSGRRRRTGEGGVDHEKRLQALEDTIADRPTDE